MSSELILPPNVSREILEEIEIPAQPEVLVSFVGERNKEDASLHRMADIISRDPAISAGILRAVNSSFWGVRRAVASIQQAATLLGLRNVTNLVLCLALRHAYRKKETPFIRRFWDQANELAFLCARIARDFTVIAPDEAYSLGLMCNCGVPALTERFPEYEAFYSEHATQGSASLVELEDAEYQLDHAVVGAFLGRSWDFPDMITQGIAYHHDVNFEKELAGNTPVIILVAIYFLAQLTSDRYQGSPDPPEWEHVSSRVLELLGIDDDDLPDIESDLRYSLQESRTS